MTKRDKIKADYNAGELMVIWVRIMLDMTKEPILNNPDLKETMIISCLNLIRLDFEISQKDLNKFRFSN